MEIKLSDWIKFKNKMSQLSQEAMDEFIAWAESHGGYASIDRNMMLDEAYALVTKYGEGSASLSALMYDTVAELSQVTVAAAEVAETATYSEVAKTINGIAKVSENLLYIASGVGRLVKQAGADTTLKNAKRDHAEFAWIPSGDTCVFCMMLASNGWKEASEKTIQGNHADHIHANCDCQFAVRFSNDTKYQGYDPDKYLEEYQNADGSTWKQKVNSMRRENYAENKDEINAQKRIAYAKRTEAQEEE